MSPSNFGFEAFVFESWLKNFTYMYTHMDALCWKWILSLWIYLDRSSLFVFLLSTLSNFTVHWRKDSFTFSALVLVRYTLDIAFIVYILKLKNFSFTVVSTQTWQTTQLCDQSVWQCFWILTDIQSNEWQVIPGLDEGILSMKVGGKRRLYIPGSVSFHFHGSS